MEPELEEQLPEESVSMIAEWRFVDENFRGAGSGNTEWGPQSQAWQRADDYYRACGLDETQVQEAIEAMTLRVYDDAKETRRVADACQLAGHTCSPPLHLRFLMIYWRGPEIDGPWCEWLAQREESGMPSSTRTLLVRIRRVEWVGGPVSSTYVSRQGIHTYTPMKLV